MTKFYPTRLLSLSLLLISGILPAQNITVINHDLSAFHSNPPSTYFAEDGAGNIWVLQWGGFTADHVVQYDGNSWTEIAFDECSNCTRRIAADNNGAIHLSTTAGIYSWNGSSWTQKSDQSAADSDIAFDSQNNLWFQTGSGGNNLASLSEGGLLTEYTSVNGNLSDITDAPDGLWLRNGSEVGVFDGTTFTAFPAIFSPLHIEVAGDGSIYVTDSFGSISRIQNGTVTPNVLSGATVSGLSHNSFAIDRANDIFWFGQQGIEPGLIFYRGNSKVYIPSDDLFMDYFTPGLVNKSFVASNGTLWVGSNFISDVAQVIPEISSVSGLPAVEAAVFPNPTRNTLNLQAGFRSTTPLAVSVYDLLGRLHFTDSVAPENGTLSLPIGNLNAGEYYISIPDEMVFARFMKE